MSARKQFEVLMRQWFSGATGVSAISIGLTLATSAVQMVQTEMVRRDVAALRERQQRSTELLSSLSEHTREFEESASRAISEQTDRLEELRASTDAALLATAARARADVLQERQDRLRDIGRLDAAVGDLLDHRERALDAAGHWLADARTLRDVIASTLPHLDYQPHGLPDIDARLATVADDLARGLPDAALSLAQETYHTLSDLRLDLELSHREWLAGRWEAVRSVTVVKQLISHARLLPVADMAPADVADAADLTEVELDRQSAARLRELEAEADAVLRSLEDDAPRLAITDLLNLIAVRVPQLQEQVEHTIATACQRVQASQIRANIADLVAEALEMGFAYQTQRASYDAEDLESGFTAWLSQPVSDNQIVLRVRPVDDGVAASQVEIESLARIPESDQVRAERARAIADYLRKRGVEIGDPVEVGPDALPVTQLARSSAGPETVVVPEPSGDSPHTGTESAGP